MWLISFLPDWFFYALLTVGLFGIVLGKFIPLAYRLPVQIVSGILFVFGVYSAGSIANNEAWEKKVAEMQVKVAELEVKAAQENVKIVEKIVTKKEYYKLKGADIVKYVDREIVKYDESCKIPKEFVDAHNKAVEK
jgi:hypothetical protein